MANKRKKTTAIVAGVTAVALLLGGTFAWTSISQQAKNESAGIVNVGGRLHDDFNGENKDVYVENFTDPLNGGQPIYARIKLTEYMEVGKEAGKLDENGDYATDRNAESVVENATIDNLDSWSIHVPADACAKCSTGDTCKIHDHWTWVMGGQTTYMPTFNKDKDSLDADINGTYAGTNPNDKIYYDDYVTYVTEGGLAVDMNDADFEAPEGATNATPLTEAEGAVTSVTGNEYYDDDTDTDENDHENEIGVRIEENVTHTAKKTADATVITMAEWLDENGVYNGAPGNYWVYDTDGWAYWANPIMPGEATGLLLSNIEMTQNPGEKCYYAINVVGQFATVNDWEYFDENNDSQFDGTDNALTLLETASKNVATVTVTNLDGKTTVEAGDTVNFSANVYVNGVQVLAADAFEWSVLNADNTVSTTSNIENGVLNVGANETSKNLIVVAKVKDDNYLGALGMSSVAVRMTTLAGQIAAIEPGSTETVTIDGIEFNVIARDAENNRTLLITKDIVEQRVFDDTVNWETEWEKSSLRTYLNGEWLENHSTLSRYVVPTTISTKHHYYGTTSSTTDSVFLLSESDISGYNFDKTYDEIKAPGGSWIAEYEGAATTWYLRTGTSYGSTMPESVYGITAEGSLTDSYGSYTVYIQNGVRPAMWVNMEPKPETVTLTAEGIEFENGYATVTDGTVITFQAAATSDGEPMENSEFVYELYNNNYESPILQEGKITSEGVWDTTGDGMLNPGGFYYVKVYVKGYPEVYAQLNFTVLS